MKRKTVFIVVVVAIFSPLSPLYWKMARWYYEPKEQQAMQFCESLVPFIEAEKDQTGHYPTNFNTAWISGKRVPDLIRLNRCYTRHGNGYFLYFANRRDFWDNRWGYSSFERRWYSYDVDEPKD